MLMMINVKVSKENDDIDNTPIITILINCVLKIGKKLRLMNLNKIMIWITILMITILINLVKRIGITYDEIIENKNWYDNNPNNTDDPNDNDIDEFNDRMITMMTIIFILFLVKIEKTSGSKLSVDLSFIHMINMCFI